MSIEDGFPVYDLLRSQVETMENKNTPLTETELRKLIQTINSLDKDGRDMIFVFIRIHSRRYSDSKVLDIPYGGQKLSTKSSSPGATDVKFDMRNFPPILLRMLVRFSCLHLRKISEDSVKKF